MATEGQLASERTSKRVLIVDDERVIADTLALILKHSGFQTMAVYDGEAAVEAAETFEPDVLLSDVVMPGITGIEAALRICGMPRNCRVILMSGNALTADLLMQANLAGHEFTCLAKPVHPKEIVRLLTESDS